MTTAAKSYRTARLSATHAAKLCNRLKPDLHKQIPRKLIRHIRLRISTRSKTCPVIWTERLPYMITYGSKMATSSPNSSS